MKFGYFCNTTNWNKKPYSQILEETRDITIYCDQNKLHQLNHKIIQTYGQTNYSNLVWKSRNSINIDKESADKLFKLLEILEDNDDVKCVHSNFDFSENVMAELG